MVSSNYPNYQYDCSVGEKFEVGNELLVFDCEEEQ